MIIVIELREQRVPFFVDSPAWQIAILSVFSKIATNMGGAYANESGNLTCPMAGLGTFSVNRDTDTDKDMHCYLRYKCDGTLLL